MTTHDVPTAQTLAVHSVEGFLTAAECAAVRAEMREVLLAHGEQTFGAARSTSVHSVDGLPTETAMKLYEPAGRVEVTPVPDAVRRIAEGAFARAAGTFGRAVPAASRIADLIYIEYGEGQFVTPHVDYRHNDDDPRRPKVAGISILLSDDHVGGEFFVETCGSDESWVDTDGVPTVREGADSSGEWFTSLRRTRWRAQPRAGDAVVYGSQLTHGTEPVVAGRACKLIGFLTTGGD
ncbi:MAG TPA: 2OG-Fe(II) oxygenase [Mycobacteriales bacterium]|jgi:hypothetical protein|nr:2OG-Fe(II) oxygenase [Mycobacteriales bacterium]